jgi:lipopolysaccharide biosynthesis regulator YciM
MGLLPMDDFQFWWLLAFPLFFVLGWLAARIDIKQVLTESRSLPAAYFKGLNYLLRGDTNKAVEVYVNIAKTHTETIELQFILGHLFRSRGELERAIRMHQRLLERKDISAAQVQTARYELALDFMKAGLFDRAEELLQELQDSNYAREARRTLLDIYQQEKEWQKAITVAQQLRETSHTYQHEIGQFYCELAANAILHSEAKQAIEFINKALHEHRKCARAHVLAGDLSFNQGLYAKAIACWEKIESQNPLYLALIARNMLTAYDKLNKPEAGTALIRGYLTKYPELDVLDVVYERILTTDGLEAAYEFVRKELQRHPTVPGLRKVFEAHMLIAPDQQKSELEIMVKLLHDNTREHAMYYCTHCGFKGRQYFWHCPACNEWEAFFPVRGLHKVNE